MAVVKNTNSDYIITCNQGNGNLVINGDVQVHGNISYDQFVDISNPYITVAANNTGIIQEMGMLAQINGNSWAGLRFNATSNVWEASTNVTKNGDPVFPYAPFGSGAGTPGGPNLSMQFNANGVFDGTTSLLFDPSNNSLWLDGAQFLTYQAALPNVTSNATMVYGNSPGLGNSGIYVSGTNVEGELITAQQAFLYSIIF